MDAIDYKILEIIQRDCTITTADIAAEVGLSQNAAWRRIKNMEDDGVVRGRVALVDPKKVGVGTVVFVMVRMIEHAEEKANAFAEVVSDMPEVVELYRMSGDIDYILKVHVADIAAYDLVYKKLVRATRLADVSGTFAMEVMKHTTAIPLPNTER